MGLVSSTAAQDGNDTHGWPEMDEQGYVQPYQVDGRWQNWWGRNRLGIASFLSRVWFMRDESGIPRSTAALNESLPVERPYWLREGSEARAVGRPGVRATWIGHATVLAEVDSAVILTDPIFSARASAVQFAGPQRYRPPACSVAELPDRLDAIVISHSHYDHLDLASVRQLHERYGQSLHWYVPSGMGQWLKDNANCSDDTVHDMVWWQEEPLASNPQVRLVLTPTNHWGQRTAFDNNKCLWGSWGVLGPRNKFWFGGDTAYCEAFAQIGRRYGPFDLAAIPVGAYNPRWFMRFAHVDPEEAVQIHQDLRCNKSLGIHWGTFKLTFEHYLEPRSKLRELAQEKGLAEDEFVTVKHGDSLEG